VVVLVEILGVLLLRHEMARLAVLAEVVLGVKHLDTVKVEVERLGKEEMAEKQHLVAILVEAAVVLAM
jgi:hypothetical protein